MYAKDIFFLKGKNKYGKFEMFICDLLDYKEEVIMEEEIQWENCMWY